jgi:TPR repeat protein
MMTDIERLALAQLAARDGRLADALAELSELSSKGGSITAEAGYTLGLIYDGGLGVERDEAAAIRYYELSAAEGNSLAHYRLAGLYQRNRQFRQALEYFRQTAPTNPSGAYWCFRIVRDHPNLSDGSDEAETRLAQAQSLGHILAKREIALRKVKGWSGTFARFGGLLELLKIFWEAKGASARGDKLKYT